MIDVSTDVECCSVPKVTSMASCFAFFDRINNIFRGFSNSENKSLHLLKVFRLNSLAYMMKIISTILMLRTETPPVYVVSQLSPLPIVSLCLVVGQ